MQSLILIAKIQNIYSLLLVILIKPRLSVRPTIEYVSITRLRLHIGPFSRSLLKQIALNLGTA